MSESEHEPHRPPTEDQPSTDAERDIAEHERPDVGLIADEDLPEDLQPTDDNPLAKDPDDDPDTHPGEDAAPGPDGRDPGAPA